MDDVALSCDKIKKTYGGVTALADVNLEVRAGEILGLVGANGSGKTTLVDIICGAQSPDRGDVVLSGRQINGMSVSQRCRRGIARTFQMPQVARDLTIRENVMCGLATRHLASARGVLQQGIQSAFRRGGIDLDEIDEICAKLGLEDLDREVERVSFGEMRLIEVARALIQHPRVLLLDEPFPAVGERGLIGMLAALDVVRADGAAVVLIDHNVDIVGSVVDRIVLLADGEVAVEGDPATCMASPIFLERYIGVV